MHVFGPLICGHGKQARAVEVCSYVTGAQEKACVHQWHLRNAWRQVLSLLHLQVRGLKLDSTEVWRIRILAIVRGLERGGIWLRIWRAAKSYEKSAKTSRDPTT